MSASPALLSRPLDWTFVPSTMLYWAEGVDGYRYQIACEGGPNGPVHATFARYDDAGMVEKGGAAAVRAPYESAAKAMAAAQQHQDEQVLAWLHPRLRESLTAPDLGAMNEARARNLVAPAARSADRTWSVPEMIDRLQRSMSTLIDAGESLQQCKQAPDLASPQRHDFEQARDTYNMHAGLGAFTHERVVALDTYLARMIGIDHAVSAHADCYRDYWEQEYRFARETYLGQRASLRQELQLGEDDPDVLCMTAPPADADSRLVSRVVIGHDRAGYRAGVLPIPGEPIAWTDPVSLRSEADDMARQIHRDGVCAMAIHAYLEGPRP